MATVRAHGIVALKAPGFSNQLDRDSQNRVLFTVNNIKTRAEWIKSLAMAFDMLPQPACHDLYAEWLAAYFHRWLRHNCAVMPNSRMLQWQHPTAPEGVLIVALHIIEHHAYAGHGDTDSSDALADTPSLRDAIETRLLHMTHRSRVVFALEKLLALPFDLGRHEHNGRYREFHEIPIPLLIGTLEPLIRPI